MTDGLGIFIETNGPQAVREVQASLQAISQLFRQAGNDTINFGQIDYSGLRRLETELRRVTLDAEKALSSMAAVDRRAAAPGIFRGATAQAGAIIAGARSGLPQVLQAADLEGAFANYLRGQLAGVGLAGGGRGQALSSILGRTAVAPELELSGARGQAIRDQIDNLQKQRLSPVGAEAAQAEAQLADLYTKLAEDTRRTYEKSQAEAQRRGVTEGKADSERMKAIEAERAAEQRQGNMEERARRMMEADFARRDQEAQRRGQLEARAEAEDAKRTAAADRQAQLSGRQQATAERLNAAYDEEQRQRRLLNDALVQQWQRIQGGYRDPQGNFYRDTLGGSGIVQADGSRLLDMQTRYGAQRAGVVPSFIQGIFGSGINGRGPQDLTQGLDNLARTAGQTAKYSILFAALFGVQQAMGDTLQEARRLSEGVRDLDIAMGDGLTVSQAYLSQLSQISRTAGANPSDAAEAAARGIRAFTETSGPMANSADEIERAGLAIADAANQISVLTGKPLKDATGDVVATASAFGLAATQASQVVDAVATARKLGGDPAQTSQGLANVAQVAKEAGLSLQETANAISLVSARVDQSGQATATRIARMLSILGGTTGQSIIGTINTSELGVQVDATAEQATQLEQIAKAYEAAGKAGNTSLQGLIRNAFGPANARETEVIFQNYKKIFGAESEIGSGQEQFNSRLDTLDGLLKLITGDITNLQAQLAQTDIFAPVGIGLKIFESLLSTLNRILDVFNRITELGPDWVGDWVKPAIVLAAEFALIARFLPQITAALSAAGLKSLGALGLSGLFSGGQGAPGGGQRGSIRGAVGTIGRNAGNFIAGNGPVLAAAALVTLYSSIQSDFEELDQIRGGAYDSVKKAVQDGQIGGAAQTLRASADEASRGGGLVGIFTAEKRSNFVDLARKQADILDESAREVEAANERLARAQAGSGIFGDLAAKSVDDVNATFSTLQASGQTASSTLVLLSQAIEGLLTPSKRVIDGAKVAAEVQAGLVASIPQAADTSALFGQSEGLGAVYSQSRLEELLTGNLGNLKKAVAERIAQKGGTALSDNDVLEIARAGADSMVANLGLGERDQQILRNRLIELIQGQLGGQGVIATGGKLSNDVATLLAQSTLNLAGDRAGNQPAFRQVGVYRNALRRIKQIREGSADADLPALVEAQRQAESLLLQAQIEDAEQVIGALDRKGKTGAAAKKSNQLFKNLALKALRAGDADALVALMENATNAQVRAVRSVIEDTIKTLTAAIMAKNATYSMVVGMAAEITDLQKQLGLLNEVDLRTGGKDNDGFGRSLDRSDGDTATQIANARRSALVAGSRKPVVQARVEMINAAASLREEAAKGKNSVAYWNAVGAYNSAKRAYQDALNEEFLALRDAKTRLGLDITDPLKMAQADLLAAQRKLRADRRLGAPASTIAQDQLDVRQQQANVEATAFQQRLSDMQTAEQLGRISHQAYIRYLQNERERLMAIKNKSRQQIDMLNQIDLELKNAMDQLSGQFNLGDIKLPTVYQARRDLAAQAVAQQTTINISVNGADVGMFQSLLSQYLGPIATGSVTTAPRRN